MTALIEDLYARGLDRRVMLIVTGEFGRTPKLEYQKGDNRPGRDHWPQSMSLVVAGGGMRVGQVVGSTDAKGGTRRTGRCRPTTCGRRCTGTWGSTRSRRSRTTGPSDADPALRRADPGVGGVAFAKERKRRRAAALHISLECGGSTPLLLSHTRPL